MSDPACDVTRTREPAYWRRAYIYRVIGFRLGDFSQTYSYNPTMSAAAVSRHAHLSNSANPSSQTHTSETTKMVNVPKASDDAETKQLKEQTDPAAVHGEDSGTSCLPRTGVCMLISFRRRQASYHRSRWTERRPARQGCRLDAAEQANAEETSIGNQGLYS